MFFGRFHDQDYVTNPTRRWTITRNTLKLFLLGITKGRLQEVSKSLPRPHTGRQPMKIVGGTRANDGEAVSSRP